MYKWFLYFFAVLFLSACGGGGLSTDAIPGGTVTQGIAVDPYIVDAVFQEIDPSSGAVLQESSPSDETGMFSFDEPLTPGSVIELVPNTGLHGGAPYQGVLRRVVEADDDGSVVVSPLTTLLANGVSPEGLVGMYNAAGLSGLTVADLYTDPMAGLSYMTDGVTDQDLTLLQASMAANAYMEVTENFQAGINELNDAGQFEIFSSMVNAMENLLNAQEFSTIAADLASDPDVTAAPIFEDFILAVVNQQQTIINLTREGMANNGPFDPTQVELNLQNVMGNSLAMVKDTYSQRVPLSVLYDGATLYHDNCSACHGILALTEKPGRTAADIQTAIDQNFGGMGSLSNLSPGEITAIVEVLPPAPAPAPTPTPAPGPVVIDGATLYGTDCSSCHGALASTNIQSRTAAGIQSAIDTISMMSSLGSLTPEEVQAIADVLPAAAPAPAPTPTPAPGPVVIDGATLYGTNCSSCHGQLASTTKAGRTAAEIQTAIDTNLGGMGFLSSLTPEEVQAIADVLPAATGPAPGPDYSDCTACHGQPPSGDTYPDTAGAHAVHIELASVAGDCAVCHLEAAHNGQVDLAFPASFDAKSGQATDNLDGTCSTVICHGGQTTPDWWTGSIAVDTQCTSCHASGSSEYNSYSSGQHSRHVRQGFSCTVCHNTDVLVTGHFSNLESTGFELSPAATIGGGSTRVGSYSNGTCSSIECHGSERW
jgi:predicted CxxxxCH...CXXCH cytochrome family protein